jgi:hypothetical protein
MMDDPLSKLKEVEPTQAQGQLRSLDTSLHRDHEDQETSTHGTDTTARKPIGNDDTADDSYDELSFVLGWRFFRAGKIVNQGAANHETPADQLPPSLYAALAGWLRLRR